ncbi:DNA/RNA nuclease SfsA [Candidatus Synechococcus calcipolaris G9]|uniref:Sugar fermentation stimulation protein homolog n=1 Tax=Candidatus Synechococcus calcipolaris G9 TaxID=1497997 RepID=A0ABT6F0D2_9SYNE|nr:DNA/RNA nuclease SfsA [Candidatus Synechococcus calcipolaris]MDG2991324.1 DNA/RNA nuclease SfsA [Candidatus Synechococcus calcipolaris G9]
MISKTDWYYPYPPLQRGYLKQRYKRFFADIELESGEMITAHCPNTGPMTGISTLGQPVMVSHSTNPKRKLAYTWEMINVSDGEAPIWVGVNTGQPNRVIGAALKDGILPELAGYVDIRCEVLYGQERSRVDFLLHDHNGQKRPVYVEVKSTTWAQGDLALFPDTVTTRGQKHLRELQALVSEARVCMLYFINRGDCDRFSPGDSADPTYGQLLRQAIQAGLEVLPYRFEVTPQGIYYRGQGTLVI